MIPFFRIFVKNMGSQLRFGRIEMSNLSLLRKVENGAIWKISRIFQIFIHLKIKVLKIFQIWNIVPKRTFRNGLKF